MKKIYASMFALAMGACITAGARTYQRANVSLDGLQMKSFETVGNLKATDMKVAAKAMKVKTNAGDEWNTLGTGWFEDGIFGYGAVEVTIEENATTPGYYRVPDAFSFLQDTALPLYIDASDPTYVRIPDQETGLNVNFTVDGEVLSGPLTILSYTTYADMLEVTPAEFKEAYPQYVITMEDGVINMPSGSILGQVGDSESLLLINDDMVLTLPGVEYVPEWGEIKTGQMFDTFFESMFMDYEPAEVNVPIQKSNKYEGFYRVIDPWFRLIGEEGQTEADVNAGYYFYIDASTPECIVVPYQSSYIRTSNGPVYIMSMSDNYETKEEFLASSNAGCNFTMDVETRTINFTGASVQLSDGSTAFVSPIFFVYPQGPNPNSMYVLSGYDTPGWIKLPKFDGISSVAVDNNNAKAEYYNIQGVRVNNPVSGQLYIVKKGSEVSKQIMR